MSDHVPFEQQAARWATRAAKVRPAVLLWALGVPLPLLLLFLLIRSCVT